MLAKNVFKLFFVNAELFTEKLYSFSNIYFATSIRRNNIKKNKCNGYNLKNLFLINNLIFSKFLILS